MFQRNLYLIGFQNGIKLLKNIWIRIDSIDSFEKKGNKIDIVYTCNYGENDVYKIKAVLVINESYDNSKYYVNEIEKMK